MAGLLDGLVGDDTTKDEFGQTQADRRAPIWSGLINAGLLAVAGGGNLMPAERAKYIAQAGGALGGIGTDMIQARSAAAQQALRGQQLDEGKRKIADRDRLRAMAQTPEWQEQMKTLDPATRALLTAAIDAGDLTHASAIMANSDKSGNRAAQLDIAQQRADLARQKLEQAQGGAFQGNGMDAQAMNTLIKGEVGSVAYYLAYNHLAKARTTIDAATGQPVTVQPLDLRRFKPPTWDGGGATPPPAPAPDGTTTSPAPAPAPAGTTTPAPDGTTTPPPAPAGSPTVTTGAPVVQKPLDPAALRKLQDEQVVLGKVTDAGQTFISEWKKASVADRVKSLSGAATPLNAAWTTLAMHLKSEAMFNLGVITGPDMALLQSVIANPATLSSGLVSEAQVEQAVNRLIESGNKAVKHREELVRGGRPGPGQQTSPAATTVPEYVTGPDGKPMLKPKE